MPGWCCCDHWEKWKEWDADDLRVATASLRDQILRLRGHASRLHLAERLRQPATGQRREEPISTSLKELGFPNPVVSSATEKKRGGLGRERRQDAGALRMGTAALLVHGHEDRRAARLRHRDRPGARPATAREPEALHAPRTSCGRSSEVWSYHCGGGPFRTLDVFTKALDARYGPSKSVEEYARKAQAAAYESHRAMLEAFGERQVHGHGRHPVDAQQRLAGDDLAPLRLLPPARRLATSGRRRQASRCTSSTPTTTARWGWSTSARCAPRPQGRRPEDPRPRGRRCSSRRRRPWTSAPTPA